MKRLSALLAIAILVSSVSYDIAAREKTDPGLRAMRASSEETAPGAADPGLRGLYEEAAVDTYCLAWYDFEFRDWQGWTRLDRTAQFGSFWHVDDFAGLEGGDFGGLVPLEGAKSMWCGARANLSDPYTCGWAGAPGYGNDWNQDLRTPAFSFVGSITLSYKCHYDSEPDYDFTRVQYDAGGGDWQTVAEYTGRGDATAQVFLPIPRRMTKIRFHFSSDREWSDQDGLWNTDGGSIVDSIRLRDNGALNSYQDFEAASVGANSAGIWIGAPGEGYGTYSGFANNLTDTDECGENFSSQIVFFIGSPVPSASYPGLYDTPFCRGPSRHEAPCQDEVVVSPVIDMTKYSSACNSSQDASIPAGDLASLAGCVFRFTRYDDNPLPNLVLDQWYVRSIDETGCPGPWRDRNIIYYCCGNYGYTYAGYDISDLVEGNKIQVAVGAVDMCDVWYLVNGNCAAHTPAPWYDNVRVYRYKADGPQWSYRDLDLFQDNFPSLEYDLESPARADAANDIFTNDKPAIRPGDSIVVGCASLMGGGIATDPTFGGPAVYLHVKCTYIGPAPTKPNLYGPMLAGSCVHGPKPPFAINFNYIGDDGVWTIVQCDTARTGAGIVKGKYCVDLNDALFTRGYEIEYYFTARDSAGQERSLPKWARSRGPYFEWTCLPTMNSNALFVDDCTDRGGSWRGGAETFWVPMFDAALPPPNNNVDIYDVNGPTSGVSNGPGSRAKTAQLTSQYDVIVWDAGDLESVTISDGTVNSDKSNDCKMLIDWMNLSGHDVGLWVCGDDVAYDLTQNDNSAVARTLLNTWCGATFVTTSYFELTGGRTGGGVVYPLVKGDAGSGIFVHSGVPDSLYLNGGCFVINQFDVLGKTGTGSYALRYPAYHTTNYYAGISNQTTNAGGYNVRTMWFGFSMQYVRDAADDMPLIRFHLADDVFKWMAVGCTQPGCDEQLTPAGTPAAYHLAQNFPNPFNPSTTIRYDMKEKGIVTLKIYNVAGELVRTLVDGIKDAGAYSITWDGRNNLGVGVASGIYFYKMDVAGFSATKKLVMLR